MKRLLSLVLALVMVFAVCVSASADMTDADYAAAAKVFAGDLRTDYTGKTVILHSNDVHGALDGYAYIATLRACSRITAPK